MQCKVDGCGGKLKAFGYCYKHYVRLKKYGTTEDRKWSQAPLEVRFWLKVKKVGENECWEWQGQKLANGYGRISLGVKALGSDGAHRVSWRLANKAEIPAGMFVMHSCDNPSCVNPKHLSIGTPKENSQDMISKGRKRVVAPVGTGNGKALINEEIVKQIRQSSDSHASLARRFGVSPNCIRGVRVGRTWSHVRVDQ
jgi:hypothetical protein